MTASNRANICHEIGDSEDPFENAEYEVVYRIMRESNTWQELRQIALLSDLPKGKRKKLLPLLIERGLIDFKPVTSGKRLPTGLLFIFWVYHQELCLESKTQSSLSIAFSQS